MALFENHGHLMAAAESGDADAVATYIRNKPKWVREKEKHTANTALHMAAKNGHVAVMKLLLAAGADADAYNGSYDTPLHMAAASGKAEALALLLDHGRSINSINSKASGSLTPLQKAITSGSAQTLGVLLATGKADLNADNPPALFFAIQYRMTDCVRVLLDAGADPNVPHKPEPRQRGYYDYDRDSRPTPPESPLNAAVRHDQTAITLMLLERGAKELQHENLLQMAALNGNMEIAAELVALGRDVNARDAEGMTALHYAAQKNSASMVQFLLANGADKALASKNNRTPLALAQQFALKENIDLLQGAMPLAEPVKRKPVALAPAEPVKPVVVPPPAPAGNDPLFDDESWKLAGRTKLVHINFYPELGRRITEIFNFESRERTIISENLNLRTEAINGQSFDKIGEEALSKALAEYRKLGGKVDETTVFKDRILKSRPR